MAKCLLLQWTNAADKATVSPGGRKHWKIDIVVVAPAATPSGFHIAHDLALPPKLTTAASRARATSR
jgi:hypothetical protein